MLDYDSKQRKTMAEISQDAWIISTKLKVKKQPDVEKSPEPQPPKTDLNEIDKMKELKRRNYQLKKVYSKTRSKVVGTFEQVKKPTLITPE